MLLHKQNFFFLDMSCSRGSIENPRTGRCKSVKGFTMDELRKIARQQRISTRGDKTELSNRILKHFMKKMRSKSKSRSSTKSRSMKKKTSRSKKTTTRRKPRAKSRSSSYYRKKAAPRKVRTRSSYSGRSLSREYYPTKGRGSFQKRHASSKRKGPSLPAQAHCWEIARGNDGYDWESRPNKNGVCRWYRLK